MAGERIMIRTKRLILRPATLRLAKAELVSRTQFQKLLGVKVHAEWPPEDLKEHRPTYLRFLRLHPDWVGWNTWYAILHDTMGKTLCGALSFTRPPSCKGVVELGYSVLPSFRCQGIGTEMVEALTGWAEAHPLARLIEAEVFAENIASIRVLEKVGYKRIMKDLTEGLILFRHKVGWE